MQTPPPLPDRTKFVRRNAVTLKLLFIAGLVLGLLIPLHLVNALRSCRSAFTRCSGISNPSTSPAMKSSLSVTALRRTNLVRSGSGGGVCITLTLAPLHEACVNPG